MINVKLRNVVKAFRRFTVRGLQGPEGRCTVPAFSYLPASRISPKTLDLLYFYSSMSSVYIWKNLDYMKYNVESGIKIYAKTIQ